jgi:hypothetical protein
LRAAISDLSHDDAVILLSSEELSLLDEVELARLAEILGDNDVEAVLFLRHWADLIPSIWQELIKQGSTVSLPLFLARVLARPASQDVLDYQKVVARIAKAFGKDSLRLVSYEALLASRRDIGEMFCRDILRVELVGARATARANASWLPNMVECVRLLNVLAVARGDAPDSTWPRAPFERMHAKGSPAIELLLARLGAHVQNIWIPRDLSDYESAVTELMEEFGDCVVNPVSGRLAPPGPPRRVAYIDTDYLLDNSLVDLARTVFADLCRQRDGARAGRPPGSDQSRAWARSLLSRRWRR